jgi:hypothetical protein
MPSIERQSPDVLGNAVVPTTAVEQYMATLINWLADDDIAPSVLPKLNRFNGSLGFIT